MSASYALRRQQERKQQEIRKTRRDESSKAMMRAPVKPGYGILWYFPQEVRTAVIGTYNTKKEAYIGLENTMLHEKRTKRFGGMFMFYYTGDMHRDLMTGSILQSIPPNSTSTTHVVFMNGKGYTWAPNKDDVPIFKYINQHKRTNNELNDLSSKELLERYKDAGGRWPLLTSSACKRTFLLAKDIETNPEKYGLMKGERFVRPSEALKATKSSNDYGALEESAPSDGYMEVSAMSS